MGWQILGHGRRPELKMPSSGVREEARAAVLMKGQSSKRLSNVARAPPPPNVAVVRGPLALIEIASFISDELGDQLPLLRTGLARSAFFLSSLVFPDSMPNPFASTRWQPCVY